ncbi:hypothetical protein ABU614_20070 [Lysobacter firmicutimachus]|uniref:Uncharacterized protein n=1 Tax=Lysobacter firmicutimachus TaxID=1792846 RepID=A0AAU8MTW6_9GAMM
MFAAAATPPRELAVPPRPAGAARLLLVVEYRPLQPGETLEVRDADGTVLGRLVPYGRAEAERRLRYRLSVPAAGVGGGSLRFQFRRVPPKTAAAPTRPPAQQGLDPAALPAHLEWRP